MNFGITNSTFDDGIADITPIFKKDETIRKENYRRFMVSLFSVQYS